MIISGSVIAHKFYDGGVEIGDNVSCQLPSIENGTTEVKGAGILGALDMPSSGQLNAMAFTANMRSINKGSINLSRPGVHNIELRFVKDTKTDGGETIPEGTKIFVTGVFKKFDPGKVEENGTMDGSIEFEVLRYRIVINGIEVLLIDKVNFIYKVNGVDYMERVRAALN
jgi:P2 family phage contractile tail tube protein